jgi:hypothetical protein
MGDWESSLELAARQGFVLADSVHLVSACRLLILAIETSFPSFLGGGSVIQSKKRSWLDASLHRRLVSIAPADTRTPIDDR